MYTFLCITVATGLAFVSTTYISTELRGKDDATNHALGGIAGSAVLGAAGLYIIDINLFYDNDAFRIHLGQ